MARPHEPSSPEWLDELHRLWPAGGVVVLRGAPGSGRSWWLGDVAHQLERQGTVTLVPSGEPVPADPFGLGLLVQALRDRFESLGDARLAGHLAAIESRRAGRHTGFSPATGRAVVQALSHVRRRGRTLLVLDDVDHLPDPVPLVESARRARCVVIVTCPAEVPRRSPAAELLAGADIVLTTPSRSQEELAGIVAARIGAVIDPASWTAVRCALGTFAGNPAMLVETVRALVLRDQAVRVRGQLVLRPDAGPVVLPDTGPLAALVTTSSPLERAVLDVACTAGPITVARLPSIARTVAASVDEAGAALDRLVRRGLLVPDDGGRLTPCCTALIASLTKAPAAVSRPAAPASRASFSPVLSVREQEIVEYIADGRRNSWIASRLLISERAVERHVTRALAKAGRRTRVDLAVAHLRG